MKKSTQQLDLSKLSATESEAIVLITLCELLGWRWIKPRWSSNQRALIKPGQAINNDWKFTRKLPTIATKYIGFFPTHPPPYTTSVDAVLPLLEKHPHVEINRVVGDGWQVAIMDVERKSDGVHTGIAAEAWEDTLPLAICYALLRAAGVEIFT